MQLPKKLVHAIIPSTPHLPAVTILEKGKFVSQSLFTKNKNLRLFKNTENAMDHCNLCIMIYYTRGFYHRLYILKIPKSHIRKRK